MKTPFLSLILVVSLVAQAQAVGLPEGDLTGDTFVGLDDLMLFTSQWLDAATCSGLGCADLDSDRDVDMTDFALLADNWSQQGHPLVLNEFMASNTSTPADPCGDFPDWIEIHNVSSLHVNLKNWYLTDDSSDLNKWQFPDVQLEPGEFLLVFATGDDIRDPFEPLHTNFKLSAAGEYLALVKPDLTIAHEYMPKYPQQCTDISYGLAAGLDIPVFFIIPTPGQENGLGVDQLGPIITDVQHTPILPQDDNDIIVTAKIDEAFAPVNTSSVQLHYRVMFGSEVAINMYDDGAGTDANSGDGTYTTLIPNTASTPGQMVRWYITANDTNNVSSRWPLFPDPLNSPQYLGTIIDDLSLTSNLPILHWFVEYPAEADTWTGTRCSMFFIGHFYDNVFVRIRGGTSSYLEKKNHKFVFNKGHYFLFSDDQIRVEKANINAAYVDTSYMREILSQELSTKAGVPSCYTFPLRLQQNGDFHSLAIFVEQVDDRFLERHGLDPDGSLYKAAINDTVFDNAYDFEAKNGSDYLDLVNLVDGLNLSGSERTNYIFDNLNIPEIISYLAINVITSEYDHTHKNYYMHFDTELGRWYIFPWDKDLSWGNIWLGTYIVTDLDVFYGGSKNILFDAIYSEPKTREMFLRRLRTLMDEILEPSSTPPSQRQIENRINELHSTMKPEADLDRAVWGFTNHPWYTGFEQVYFNDGVALLTDQYLPARRNFLYVINAVMNGGEIPNSQPPNPLINIDPDIEFNPPSGNQDEEYIRLNNPNAYAIDISGFKLTGAVKHTFQPGVVVPAGDSLYVSPNVNAFRARTTSPSGNEGLFVQGNYSGHLSSWGETINLLDTDSNLVDTYTYPPSPSDQQRHLRITEMMYHPADPNQPSPYNDEDFEFIELKNIGPNVLDLNGVKFTDGIDYEFPGPKTYNTTLITPDDVWKYNQYGTDLGTTWRMPDYNDSSWPLGAAVLYDETVSPWPPEPWIKNTNLTVELGKITFYFRKHFYLDADPTVDDITLQLYTLIDDGVVLYLNGVEVKRLGMPDGTITYSTLADRTVYDAVTEGPFTIPSSNLVAGENVLAAEVHQITSTSSDIVLGLMLEATISTHTPNVILDPNEYVLLVKDHNAFASRYPNVYGVEILGPYDGQLSNNGEKIKLEDFTNSTILEFDYKDDWYPVTDGAGFSLVIFNSNDPNLDSWDDKESWHSSIVLHGSPGQDDPPPVQNPADIVANEVLAHSHALDPDWIELHNTTETSIDIGGWFLSDDKDDLTKYEISSGTSIDANGYRVFYQDTNFGDTSTDPGCHTPFALSENGETVYLSSGSGGQLAGGFSQKQDFGASETSVSFGLYQKSTGQYDFVPMDSTTPGYDNDYPKVGPVVITEVMYNPQSGDQNAEYIELYNTTASLVPLYDPATTVPWKFTDGVEFTFPPGITLEAGRHLLLVKDIPTFNSEYGSMPPGVQLLGPYDGQLDNGGKNLQISMPGDVDESGTRYYICIDHLDYDNDYPWPGQADANGFSLTRIDPNLYGNDVINWDANTPSPGIAAP